MLPHNTPDWHNFSYYMVTLTHKKGAGVCSESIPGLQAFALPFPHRIDKRSRPAPIRYIYIYKICTRITRRRFGCHLPAVG